MPIAVRLAAIVLLLSGIAPAAARELPFLVKTEASKQLVEDGRNSLLAFRMQEGEAAFYRLLERPDGAVAAYHNLTASALLKAIMTDRAADYAAFWSRSDSTLALLKEAPEGKWRMYLYAENALQRMVVYAKEERYVRAALAARTAYNRTEQVIERYPDFYEPYKGMGLLHVVIGSLPRTYRDLLGLFGFTGEVEKGLDELRLAAERSVYSREEAALGLALADAFLFSKTEKASARLRKLYDAHPGSPLFAFFHGFALLKDRQAAEAERVLSAIAERKAPGYLYIDYIDHWLAEALFRQNRFVEAQQYYERYLARHKGPELKAVCRLGLARSLEMQGRREEAVAQYEQVEATRSFDDDVFAEREAGRRLKHAITPIQRTLVRGGNAFDAGNYEAAESVLMEVWTDPQIAPDDRSEAAYRLGRVYQVTDRPDEALAYYIRCINLPQDALSRWAPWSQYYIGQLYDRQGKTDLAENAYRAALAYDATYDYFQSLEQNAKAALKRLDRVTVSTSQAAP